MVDFQIMKKPSTENIAIKFSIFILLLSTFFLEIEISNIDKNSFLTMVLGSLFSLMIRFFIKPLLIKKLFEKDKPTPDPELDQKSSTIITENKDVNNR